MVNRTITQYDRETAARFRSIWLRKKQQLDLTQVKAAKILGVSQATFSQYLNCIIALNTDMVLKLAELLRVDAGDIDPKLKQQLRVVDVPLYKVQVAVIAALPGPLAGVSVLIAELTGMKTSLYAIQLTEDAGDIPAGAYVLLDPSQEVNAGGLGLLTTLDQARYYGKLLARNTREIVFQDRLEGTTLRFKPKEVFSLHSVHSIQLGG